MLKLAVVVLAVVAVLECEAGLLVNIGQKAENLGLAVHNGTVKVEEKIGSILNRNKNATEVKETKDAMDAKDDAASPPVVGDNMGMDGRQQILGVPRCNPGETFHAGQCRPSED